jgi:MFS family permease
MISLARYTALFHKPGYPAVVAISALGRLPIGITGLAILLLAQSATGSYATGGSTGAFYVAGLALIAPALGRAIDRLGPRPVLLGACALFPTTLLGVVLAFQFAAPLWLALSCAAAAGASFPPITVCMRTYLKRQFADDALLAAAYSLESVLIETIFIAGPLLVALFVVTASAAAAVLFSAACGCAGTVLFLRLPELRRWRIEPRRSASAFGPLAERGFLSFLAVVVCYAGAFGLVEIATMAYATERNEPALAGILLGVMSIGSALGGLVYGGRTWRLPLVRQFPLTLALMGIAIGPLALPLDPWLFAAWCVAAGIAMAPALIMQSMLVARTARAEHLTEAFTWSTTGLLAGVGIGLSLGGQILEAGSSRAVFAAAGALSVCAAVLASVLVRRA